MFPIFYSDKEEAAGQNFLVRTEVLTDHVRLGKFNNVLSSETTICRFLSFFCELGIVIDGRNAAFIDGFRFNAISRSDAL